MTKFRFLSAVILFIVLLSGRELAEAAEGDDTWNCDAQVCAVKASFKTCHDSSECHRPPECPDNFYYCTEVWLKGGHQAGFGLCLPHVNTKPSVVHVYSKPASKAECPPEGAGYLVQIEPPVNSFTNCTIRACLGKPTDNGYTVGPYPDLLPSDYNYTMEGMIAEFRETSTVAVNIY